MTQDAFLIADCSDCQKTVLLSYDVREDVLVTTCLHCDVAIDRVHATEATPAQLRDLGYIVGTDETAHGGSGCRDGQCGVVQPDP